jgi:hypothetical protein
MRKKDAKKSGGTSLFSCNGCHALNYWIYAKARKYVAENGSLSYHLLTLPDSHECQPSTVNHLVRQFRKQLYATVEFTPTRSVNRIYEAVRNEFARLLEQDDRLFFLEEIPSFRCIQVVVTTETSRNRRELSYMDSSNIIRSKRRRQE